ncbi:hypothetical protein ND748_20355 [Frankia sp. AiPs1]|uniref:hypothetical protein n=1 Tax=Frankia sp. AiPs1 TaxID=573493 RepID=UPI002043A01A|nr:hypothetical protein [Frankia sp. AiPs1]MCM3924011.1 hypothetical protein [Frankia sp. AiPs1]
MKSLFRRWLAVPVMSLAIVALAAVPGFAAAARSSASVSTVAAVSPEAQIGRSAGQICYRAHVAWIGWQTWRCDGQEAGTTGQALSMQALEIRTRNVKVCASAHVQSIGWQPEVCATPGEPVTIGTTGQNLRLEAIRFFAPRGICAEAHLADTGWQGQRCGQTPQVGTAGEGRAIQAIKISP